MTIVSAERERGKVRMQPSIMCSTTKSKTQKYNHTNNELKCGIVHKFKQVAIYNTITHHAKSKLLFPTML